MSPLHWLKNKSLSVTCPRKYCKKTTLLSLIGPCVLWAAILQRVGSQWVSKHIDSWVSEVFGILNLVERVAAWFDPPRRFLSVRSLQREGDAASIGASFVFGGVDSTRAASYAYRLWCAADESRAFRRQICCCAVWRCQDWPWRDVDRQNKRHMGSLAGSHVVWSWVAGDRRASPFLNDSGALDDSVWSCWCKWCERVWLNSRISRNPAPCCWTRREWKRANDVGHSSFERTVSSSRHHQIARLRERGKDWGRQWAAVRTSLRLKLSARCTRSPARFTRSAGLSRRELPWLVNPRLIVLPMGKGREGWSFFFLPSRGGNGDLGLRVLKMALWSTIVESCKNLQVASCCFGTAHSCLPIMEQTCQPWQLFYHTDNFDYKCNPKWFWIKLHFLSLLLLSSLLYAFCPLLKTLTKYSALTTWVLWLFYYHHVFSNVSKSFSWRFIVMFIFNQVLTFSFFIEHWPQFFFLRSLTTILKILSI